MNTNSQQARDIVATNLKRLLRASGKSQADLIKDTKISQSSVSDYFTAKKYPRPDKMQILADYFGVLKSDIMEDKATLESIGATPYTPTRRIPILGRIAAGLPLYAEEHIEGYTYTDLNGSNEYFALRVQGDSMNARRINDGDIVVIRRQSIVDNGEIAVVLVNGCDATIKQFYKNGDTVTLVPQSNNPTHTAQMYNCKNTEVQVLGKLVRNVIDF